MSRIEENATPTGSCCDASIGRAGKTEEIANAVVWLLSDKASFVTGHTLLVDGGWVGR